MGSGDGENMFVVPPLGGGIGRRRLKAGLRAGREDRLKAGLRTLYERSEEEIDRVMAANEGMVAKLKAYRSSVIWEAVTGKTCL